MENAGALAEQILRCQQLLDEGTTSALIEAVDAAHLCISHDTTQVLGFLLMTKALFQLHRYEDAVAWYKKVDVIVSLYADVLGLDLHPENEDLQIGLRQARVAVLNELLDEEEETDDEAVDGEDQLSCGVAETTFLEKTCGDQAIDEHQATEITQRASSRFDEVSTSEAKKSTVMDARATQATVFQTKMERIQEHLDGLKLARLMAVYIFAELINLRRVTTGLGLLLIGLLAQAIVHRQKIMVVSMLAICLYHSQLKERALRFTRDWVEASTDKLGAFTWAPRIFLILPVIMKVFGQLKFMIFLQQDVHLTGIVLTVTILLVANSLRPVAGQQAKLWGEGRRLKFTAYSTTIVYWVIWRGQWTDTIRLLGPALIDAGGIVLGSVTSSELQEICRLAFKRLYGDVANDIQADVDLDAWFLLGLGNWIIEYWQQPTDFTLEMLAKMLTECFDSMEKAAIRAFSPELRHLRNQLTNVEISDELQLLIAYLKRSVNAIPPPKSFGMAMLFAKRCSSFVTFGLLVVFFGVISLPLVPFVVSESRDAKDLYVRYRDGRLHKKDGLELMLLDSPLLRVWDNFKGCIYCLEGSVTFSKAVATGTHIVSAAARISRLAAFASRMKKEGVFANAHDIPDHLANAYLVTKDSSLIIDGVCYIRDSAHLQDLQTWIANWWSAGRVKADRQGES